MTRDLTVQRLWSFGKSNTGRRSLWALGLGLALTAALPGCVAHAEGALVADYPAEYVETVPPRIEYYPSVVYRGSPAYLVEGRWYYRTHDRWVVFRDEPGELRDYRVRQAPAYLRPPSARYRQDRWAEQRRFEQRREAERRADQQREAARREQERRRAYFEAQHAREQQRAEQQRRFEQQRAEQHRAEEERRVAEQRGRAKRRNDRAHGDQHDFRDQRDRRHYRTD